MGAGRKMEEENKSSFVRWQSYTLQQFTFTNNLVIGLCTGILAVFVSSIIDKGTSTNLNKNLLTPAFVFIFLSLAAGVITAWLRLLNFRTTTQVAKKRKEGDKKDIGRLRREYTRLGKITWAFLTAQLTFFIMGSFFLLILVIHQLFS
jgi:hypothetical protein